MGYTIPQILQACCTGLNDNQIQHFMTENKAIVYVTFVFHDVDTGSPNMSEIIYPGFQSGGIINAKDLPNDGTIDTTHEYIELDVALGNINAGKAYLYNVKYEADEN